MFLNDSYIYYSYLINVWYKEGKRVYIIRDQMSELRIICNNLHHKWVQLIKNVLDGLLIEITVRGGLLLVGIVDGEVDVFEEREHYLVENFSPEIKGKVWAVCVKDLKEDSWRFILNIPPFLHYEVGQVVENWEPQSFHHAMSNVRVIRPLYFCLRLLLFWGSTRLRWWLDLL